MTNQQSLFRFNADVSKFSETIQVDLGLVVKKIVFDVFTKIVWRTPVDTGRCRASWGIERSKVGSDQAPDGMKVDPQTATGIAREQLQKLNVPSQELGRSVWWIYNNLPYAVALEYGHSRQAPSGMVRIALAEVEAEISGYLG
jgi:hypothetical protein